MATGRLLLTPLPVWSLGFRTWKVLPLPLWPRPPWALLPSPCFLSGCSSYPPSSTAVPLMLWLSCFLTPLSLLEWLLTWMAPLKRTHQWKVKVKSLSRVRLFATPWTVAYQAPQSMEFSRQEYWSGLPFPSPGALPNLKPPTPWRALDSYFRQPISFLFPEVPHAS